MIAHDSREFGDARPRLRAVASHQREKGRKRRGVREHQERHLVTRRVYKQRRSAALAEWRALAA